MLAHQSLPTSQHEKPCFDAQKVKRQEMYISTSPPRTTPHISVVGTITQLTAAVTIAPRRYTVRHTTSCMRFSSQHTTLPYAPQHGSYCTRSTFPHSEKHNTRALHPYKADIACDARSFTTTPSLWHQTINWHLAINILPYPTLQSRHPWAPRVGSSYTGCAFALRRATILLIRWCHNTLYARILYI